MTTSADAAAFAGVAAIEPPAAAKASRAGALGSTPVTLWPCFKRFFAMPAHRAQPDEGYEGSVLIGHGSSLDAVFRRPAESGAGRGLGLVFEADVALVAQPV